MKTLSKTAFIAIDLQTKLLEQVGETQPFSRETLLENNAKLIKHYGNTGALIVLVSVYPDSYTIPREEMVKLAVKFDETDNVIYVTKNAPSAYSGTDLENVLKSRQIENIVLTGISTNNGVLKSARDFVKSGLNVTTVEDACTARTKADHDEAIAELSELGQITSTEEIVSKI